MRNSLMQKHCTDGEHHTIILVVRPNDSPSKEMTMVMRVIDASGTGHVLSPEPAFFSFKVLLGSSMSSTKRSVEACAFEWSAKSHAPDMFVHIN